MSENTVDISAFYGVKAGMTRIFDDKGNHVPVTVIKLIPNIVSQVKTKEKDGYEAYQVAYYEKREKLITKPVQGQLKKANIEKYFARFAEIKAEGVDAEALGKATNLTSFEANTMVDVSGVSKGKGFAGVFKKFGFSGGPMTHGSHFHRTTGSIGNRATPGRVFAGKKMPGQLGNKNKTMQNLTVVEVNSEKGYLLIRGSVPGSKNGFVRVAKAIKK